jgi:hypothetical protein
MKYWYLHIDDMVQEDEKTDNDKCASYIYSRRCCNFSNEELGGKKCCGERQGVLVRPEEVGVGFGLLKISYEPMLSRILFRLVAKYGSL